MPDMKGERPKVLIGAPVYLPRQGGSSTYFSNLMERLRDRVDFIVYSCRNPDAAKFEDQGSVKVHRIQPFILDAPKLFRYIVLPPITFFQLIWLRMRYGKMIIHAHSNGAYGFIISILSSLIGQEMLKEVQDMSDPGYNIRMGNVTRYVSTGTSIRDQLISYGVPSDKIITYPSLNPEIPLEVRKSIKQKPFRHDGDMELLCISALRPYKGVEYLLESMRMVQGRDPSIKLTIIGEGGMRDELLGYMKKHGITNTTLRGFVPDYHDVLRMMAKCDILVLSSASDEGNPRVILEAFQFERPVIATAAGGTPELIENGENGILLPPREPKAFAEAILRLSGDQGLREKLGKNGRRFLEKLPTWDDLASDILKVYRDIWKRM
ncbi:MAG: glycosyltransferase family 4 protein [Candidatus Thermoplasmatota archaeon]|nr:glycosyltransferase family 4 protein [Candidatus Thermoplasmatota archaeon]